MRETCTSGSMSGSRKRDLEQIEAPAQAKAAGYSYSLFPHVTAPTLDSTWVTMWS